MFWDKGYAPSQNIEELLEKENVTVEEFLDEDDILQECKTLKKSIVNYFTRPEVIRRLVELITTEPSEDLPLTQRFRHANMACEILTLGIPSLDEKLLSDADTLQLLYSYLENEPPLNPLLSSFFSKTFSMLFTKKTEQDWFLYQQMCLKLLEHIKTQNNFLDLICKHFSTPVVPELILQMMRVDGGDIKRNLYEWLTEEKLVERLIGILGSSEEFEKHENVAEFLCDLLEHGRGMRQAEQEDGSFEPAFNGSNPILQNLESEATIEALLNVILHPDAKPSSIISGISVVLTLLSPGSFMDEPNSERLKFIQVREKEINEQIVSTVIRVIAPRLKHFNELLKNPPKKPELVINAGTLNDPFGNTRLQVCRLFTVLLQTKKLEVTEAICETDFFETVMALFQKYCWNNFLHCEVEKYFETIFCYALSSGSNSNNNSTHASDGSYNGRNMNSAEKLEDFDKVANFLMTFFDKSCGGDNKNGGSESENKENEKMDSHTESTTTSNTDENMANEEKEVNELKKEETKEGEAALKSDEMEIEQEQQNEQEIEEKKHSETTETETTKTMTTTTETETETTESIALAADDAANQIVTPPDGATLENEPNGPFLLQKHLIVECKIISKLLACWLHNAESEKSTNRRRLGYMGHLLKILKHLRNCISESEHISALIESNLTDAAELELWQNIMKQDDGELTKAQATQCRLLANCNPHDVAKGFCADNQDVSWTYSQNWDSQLNDDSAIANPYAYDAENFLRNRIDDDDDDDNNEDNSAVVGGTVGSIAAHQQPTARIEDIDNLIDQLIFLTADNIMEMPAGATNRIQQQTSASTTLVEGIIPPPVDAWADFGNEEFADFDAHFDSFASDMGESFSVSPTKNKNVQPAIGTAPTTNATKKNDLNFDAAKDNNANLEKMTAFVVDKCVNAVVGEENKFSDDDDDDDEDEDVIVHIVQNDDDDDGNNGDRMKGFYQSNSANAVDDDFDDFDDDEGMWTKPLGGGFSDGDNANDNNTTATTTTNGPPQLSTVPPTNDLGSIWLDAVNTKQLNIVNSIDLNVDIKNNIPNTSSEQQSAIKDATTGVVTAAVVDSSSSTVSSTKPDATKDATTPPTVVN